MPTELTVFLGPTANSLDPITMFGPRVALRPPVRRGDIARLVARADRPSQIAIVDGTFHSYPAVGHAEIREAIRQGFVVWGLSSMGAIRAAEMRAFGMRGFGRVFRRFATDDDFADDEVALIHAAEPPFTPLSEPLIHIRAFLDDLVARRFLLSPVAERMVVEIQRRWFGDRTLALVHRLLVEATGRSPQELREVLAGFSVHRVKTHDLVDFAARSPWRGGLVPADDISPGNTVVPT